MNKQERILPTKTLIKYLYYYMKGYYKQYLLAIFFMVTMGIPFKIRSYNTNWNLTSLTSVTYKNSAQDETLYIKEL